MSQTPTPDIDQLKAFAGACEAQFPKLSLNENAIKNGGLAPTGDTMVPFAATQKAPNGSMTVYYNGRVVLFALSRTAAAGEGLVRTTFPSADNPGPPFYARINDFQPHFFDDGEWAAIYFYRNPGCVPPEFNLLSFFDFAGAFGCPLEVQGFNLWEVEPLSGPPKIEISTGDGAVPVWFVPVDVINQAAQDGELTIGELAGLEGLLVGTADQFNETHHPSPLPPELGGGGHPNPKLIMNAHGSLEDGRRFNLHITWLVNEDMRVVRIHFR